jgi:hypothetical protein
VRDLVVRGSWLRQSVLPLGVVFAACGWLACGSNGAGRGSPGSSAGAGGTPAVSGAGGMPAVSGAGGGISGGAGGAGEAARAGSSNAGGGASGGPMSGAAGSSSQAQELAVSLYACKPDCPRQQYCALIGPECTTEPCLAHAVCRDLPTCSASLACPLAPAQSCLDDPSDSCNPADGAPCPGRCYCTHNFQGCPAPSASDSHSDICACVMPGPATSCLDVRCPGDDECELVLGKAYCLDK